ncbi:MAG: hypothetical protein MUC97_08005 [Bernardetiaceae bacterium]|jgi:hypothetical protein|nr:hypothetical protein [Bernardetiaceae bacterium]
MRKITTLIVLMGTLALSSPLAAQAPDTPPPNDMEVEESPGDGGGDIPLDGGVGWLVAAGLGLGIKKYFDTRQRKVDHGASKP